MYPLGTPRLQGLKLVDGEYRPLKSRLVDGKRTIRSEVLGLDVCVEGELLRFRDVATGKDIRHRAEIEADEERAQAQARQEAAQRKTAEAHAQRESTRADQEAARADQEAARAEQEAAIRSAAEARVAELEAALRLSRTDRE